MTQIVDSVIFEAKLSSVTSTRPKPDISDPNQLPLIIIIIILES